MSLSAAMGRPQGTSGPESGGLRGEIVAGFIVPGMPQPLLAPEKNAGWGRLRRAYGEVRAAIAELQADCLILYSTQWLSVIGHQIQADPEPRWVHVDPEWHDLGAMPYHFRVDAELSHAYATAAAGRGLNARTVAYHGFPMDTGSVVALTLLNPDNALAASVVSCNMYADRAETVVLGKALVDAVARSGRRAVVVAVTALSARQHTAWLAPEEDHFGSAKDDEWNRKLLELLGRGRLEDVSQLARQFAAQAHADHKLKAVWWLAAALGQHNAYDGKVYAYAPVWGTGAALVGLWPTSKGTADPEFDEDDAEVYSGQRNVLADGGLAAGSRGGGDPRWVGPEPDDPRVHLSSPSSDDASVAAASQPTGGSAGTIVRAAEHDVPAPVGAYPHARWQGDLLFLSGVGPRQPGTDEIPGGPVRDDSGAPRDYDIEAQTRACVENVRRILVASGSSLERVVDITVFLIDMQRDFPTFNRVYGELLGGVGATRTTLEVRALPTPIAVEMKVVAR